VCRGGVLVVDKQLSYCCSGPCVDLCVTSAEECDLRATSLHDVAVKRDQHGGVVRGA